MYKSVRIIPRKLNGKVCAPPSKSAAHRAILSAALSCGESKILNLAYSEDISATLSVIEALGANVRLYGSTAMITGMCKGEQLNKRILNCNESGSTLRFIIPIALALGGNFFVSGKGRLMERPLDDYYKIFDTQGIFHKKENDKIFFDGKLSGGRYELSGNVSSQYITGLLYSLPLLSSDSEIVITTPIESLGYIKMTLQMLEKFGISIKHSDDYRNYHISGSQTYKACDYTVEGDYSQAAFYYVANELGNNLEISGLLTDSLQGDKAILDVINFLKDGKSEHTIDVSQIPDLVPIISVLATQTDGVTHIINAGRLRIKESDRLTAITQELTKLGAKIDEFDDSLTIHGKTTLSGGVVDAHNDHRIAMSLAIASTVACGEIKICGSDSVKKSYKDFWEVFCSLGGIIENGE